MEPRFIEVLGRCVIGASVLLSGAALSQLSSEGPILRRSLPRVEQIENEKTTAPYRLGPLRLSPFLGIRDFTYNSNVYGTEVFPVSDWTLTLYGGTSFLMPTGGKSVFHGEVSPAYVYWEKLSARRGWVGDYKGEWIGLFNRITLEAGGAYKDEISLLSSESEQTVRNHFVSGKAGVEIDVFRRLSLVARWDGLQTTYTEIDTGGGSTISSSTLDRTEQSFQAGVRYKPNTQFSVGLLGDFTRIRFQDQGQDRDNDGRSVRLVVRYDRPTFYLELSGGYATAEGQSALTFFPIYRTGIYRWFVSYFPSRTLELEAYGWRRPVYSYFLDNPYYFETRNGIQLNVTVTPRIILSGFGNAGSNRYPVEVFVIDSIVTRKDDIVSWGGGLSWNFWRSARISGVYAKDHYTSNVLGVQRDVYRVTLNLAMGGKILR